jgi:IS5 family transposase
LENLDRKLTLVSNLIDWSLLEHHLGHHFKHKAAPPFRLMIGLLYLKTMNDISYEETVEKWDSSVYWQRFCGSDNTGALSPIRPSTLSIWNREIGDQGFYWMRVALTIPFHNETLH